MLTTFSSTVKTVKVTMQFLSAARLYRIGWTFLVEDIIRFDFEIPFDAAASVTLPEGCATESNHCLTSGRQT